MKQILQDLDSGKTRIVEAPTPQVASNELLINTTTSLISSGTERMLIDFSKASYLEKMRQQPEKVKMVIDKVKTDGLFSTVKAVRDKLSQPLTMGYCNVGVVADIGDNVTSFRRGDRVVSNGPHADVVHVAQNLCAHIPDNVDDESAAFVVVASIALQGIRLATASLGECVVVIGAGLIGLLTIQLLKAQGCRVLAIDLDADRLLLAAQFGAEICNPAEGDDPVARGLAFSQDRGIDAVLITAATPSSDPVTQAARMSRKRGRIVLIGATGLALNRADFYEKELTFQVSCSYGPGRYDPVYENQGVDYPVGFVRWTAQRNFEAVLTMLAEGRLDVKPLITHRFAFEDTPEAYRVLSDEKNVLGIVLGYTTHNASRHIRERHFYTDICFDTQKPVLGFIGAGNYATRVLIPAFKAAGAQFHTIVTFNGLSGAVHGEKAGFMKTSTDVDAMMADEKINTIVIATRHDTHAHFVRKALQAGKHVYVEKPLALNLHTLADVEAAYHMAVMVGRRLQLMVGFNRRFAPHIQKMKALLETVHQPKTFIMTVNAGAIAPDHWTQNPVAGGGRILGEACHFIDLMQYLAGTDIVSVHTAAMQEKTATVNILDKVSLTLSFADGSVGTIHYFANGAASFPKERIEVFTAGRVLQLDNFRRLIGFGWPRFRKMSSWRQNKGQMACARAFLQSIESGEPLIPIADVFATARVTIQADQALRQREVKMHE